MAEYTPVGPVDSTPTPLDNTLASTADQFYENNAGANLNGIPAGLNLLKNADVANAYRIPGTAAMSQNIAAGAIPVAANQMASSPLAGITTLGQTANAGTTNAGRTAVDTTGQQVLLNGQITNINDLYAQSQGLGPSLAAEQAKRQGEQNVAAQMAMLGSQRGASNTALGTRQALEAGSVANQQGVQAGVQGRMAEQLAARQQLTAALSGTQGQVMQGAQNQAGLNQNINIANAGAANAAALQNAAGQNQAMLTQGEMTQQVQLANALQQAQTTLANLQAKQQTQGLNAQEYNAMLQAQMTLANNASTASQNYISLLMNQQLQQQNIDAGRSAATAATNLGYLSAGIAGGSALGGALVGSDLFKSDRRAKTKITSGTRSIKGFLDQIGPVASEFALWSK